MSPWDEIYFCMYLLEFKLQLLQVLTGETIIQAESWAKVTESIVVLFLYNTSLWITVYDISTTQKYAWREVQSPCASTIAIIF